MNQVQKPLLVICAKRYNGHELWTLLGVLQERDYEFEVVSQALLIRDELTLKPNTIERTVYDVSPDEIREEKFAAVCVVSGNMSDTEAYWTDPHVLNLLQAAREINLVVAAICCSVPTLAPVCKDVAVSYFPLMRSRYRLRDFGAVLRNTSLTVDGHTVTAENQMITQMWAEEICNLLEGKPQQYQMEDSGFTPKGSERKMDPLVRAAIDADRGYGMVLQKGPNKGKIYDPKAS